jgi:hypothetical protein
MIMGEFNKLSHVRVDELLVEKDALIGQRDAMDAPINVVCGRLGRAGGSCAADSRELKGLNAIRSKIYADLEKIDKELATFHPDTILLQKVEKRLRSLPGGGLVVKYGPIREAMAEAITSPTVGSYTRTLNDLREAVRGEMGLSDWLTAPSPFSKIFSDQMQGHAKDAFLYGTQAAPGTYANQGRVR